MLPSLSRKNRGNHFENEALTLLKKSGFKLLNKNFRTKLGEIDLVLLDRDTLVFCEVRSKSGDGWALESIDERKQQRIRMVASQFISDHNITGDVRFDVVTFDDDKPMHLKDAF